MGIPCSILPLLLWFLTILSPSCWFCQASSSSCYTDTRDVLLAQLQGVSQIEICAGTTLEIGIPITATPTAIAATPAATANTSTNDLLLTWSAMMPLVIVKENIHIYCGSDKRSTNNCIVQGGATQLITTTYDNPLYAALFSGLDTSNITIPPFLGLETNNLKVTGLTFQGQLLTMKDHDDPAFDDVAGTSVSIGAPGYNMVFDDCIFQNLATSQTVFAIKRYNSTNHRHFHSHEAFVTLQNCIFRNLQFASCVVENIEQGLSFDNVSFTNITYQPWLLSQQQQQQQQQNDTAEESSSFATVFNLFNGAETYMSNVTMKDIETWTTLIFQDASPTFLMVGDPEPVTIENYSIHNQSSRSAHEYCTGGWFFYVEEELWLCDDFVFRYAPPNSSWTQFSSPDDDMEHSRKTDQIDTPTESGHTVIRSTTYLYASLLATIVILWYY